jgi:hypothetical protein
MNLLDKFGNLIQGFLSGVDVSGNKHIFSTTESGILRVQVDRVTEIVNSGYRDFINLDDTPVNYAGSAGKSLAVNSAGDAVEFTSLTEDAISDLEHDAIKIQGKTVPAPTASDDTKTLTYDLATDAFIWQTTASGFGDMQKTVYDSDDSGVVDLAESVPWTGITGKPSTYTPAAHTHVESDISNLDHDADKIKSKSIDTPSSDNTYAYYDSNTDTIKWGTIVYSGAGSGDMQKAIYDTNDNGIVDYAEGVDWNNVDNTPSTYPPESHTHVEDDISNLDHDAQKIKGIPVQEPLPAEDGYVLFYDDTDGRFEYKDVSSTAGDMNKSTYDTNDNGIVDEAEEVEWSGVLSKPTTFPPESHTHVEDDITNLDHTDINAIHTTVSGEINGLTVKASPVDDDILVIEDSANSYHKKKINLSAITSGATATLRGAATFTADGVLSTEVGTLRWYSPENWNITQVRVSVGVPSTTNSVIVDINKNGSSIFSTLPEVAVGNYTTTSGMSVSLTSSDYLTLDIDQSGDAEDLTVQIKMEEV